MIFLLVFSGLAAILLIVVPSASKPASALQSVTTTSTSSNAAEGGALQKTCVSNGYYWVIYSDGANGELASSLDGATWTIQQNVGAANQGGYVTLACSGNTLAYARQTGSGGNVFMRYGTTSGSGTISWSISESTDATGGTPGALSIDIDSSANIWVVSRDGITAECEAYKYSSGSWTNNLTLDGHAQSNGGCSVIALTSGKMAIIQDACGAAGQEYVFTYSGSAWASPVLLSGIATGTSNCVYLQGITHVGDTVEVISGAQYFNFTYGHVSWSVPFTFTADTVWGVGENLATDGTKLVAVYAVAAGVATIKETTLASTTAPGSWGTPRMIGNGGGYTSLMAWLGGGPYISNGEAIVVFTASGSSPFTVWAQPELPIGPIVQYVTNVANGVGSISCTIGAVNTNDILVMAVSSTEASAGHTLAVSDTIGGSYSHTTLVEQTGASNDLLTQIFYVQSASGSSDVISASLSSGNGDFGVVCMELTTLVVAGATGATGSGSGATAQTYGVGSFTPPSGSFVIGVSAGAVSAGGLNPASFGANYLGSFTNPAGAGIGAAVFHNAEYSISWSGSATTVPFVQSSNGNNIFWAESALYLLPPVVQPLTVTMANSAPSAIVTVNGCNPSPPSFPSDGASHNIDMNNACMFTLSFSNSGPTRDGFSVSSAFSATSATQTSSSTPISLTAYLQYSVLFSYSVIGGGNPTPPTLTCFQIGVSGSCGTVATTSSAFFVDYGSAWSTTNPLGTSTGSHRWDSGSASGTITSLTTITIPYYRQFAGNLSYSVSGGGSPGAPSLGYITFGSLATTSLTGSTTSYWFDASGATCSVTNPLTGSGPTERWFSSTSCNSGNSVTASFAQAFVYYHQFLQTESYRLLGGGVFTPPTYSYVQGGGSQSLILTTSPVGVFADSGSAWSVTNPLGGSTTTERAFSSGTVSGTSSSSTTSVYTYYHQFGDFFSWTLVGSGGPNTNPSLFGTQFGNTGFSVALTTAGQIVWLDAGTPWHSTNPFVSNLQSFYPSNGAGIASDPTINIMYSLTPRCPTTQTVPYQNALQGCVFGTSYFGFFNIIGDFFGGILELVVFAVLYTKSENTAIPILIYVVGGTFLSIIFPPLLLPLSAFMLTVGLAAGALQTARRS